MDHSRSDAPQISHADSLHRNPRETARRARERANDYQLSAPEKVVLDECRAESLYYRSLPFAGLAALGAHRLIRMGYLTTGRFGSSPKIGFAMFIGYIFGKISYINKCKQKFLKLNNSEIGNMIRQGKNMAGGTSPGANMLNRDNEDNAEDDYQQPYDDQVRLTNDQYVNLEIDTSNVRSLDDRPESLYPLENEFNQDEDAKPKMTTTYDELRKKNREQNVHGRMQGHFDPLNKSQTQKPSIEREMPRYQSKSRADEYNSSKPLTGKLNMYGDSLDD